MVNNNKNGALAQRYVYMKQRIAKAQGKAKFAGFLYFLGIFVIAALACLSFLELPAQIAVKLGVTTFFQPLKTITQFKTDVPTYLVACLYALMLVVLLINCVRSLFKLSWLFKKKASRLYGFNRNAYAMDDLGRMFSGSFACVLGVYFFIALISGIEGVKVHTFAYVFLGVGLLLHFLCGIVGGKVSLFDLENGILEEGREVGSFAPFVRNLLQLAATGAAIFFFLKYSVISAIAADPLWANGMAGVKEIFTSFKTQPMESIVMGLHLLTAILLLCMISYSTGTTEFDIDGAETPGRKTFVFVSMFLAAIAGVMYFYFKEKATIEALDHKNVLIVACIALAAFLLELFLIRMPKRPRVDIDEVDTNQYFIKTREKSGVYLNQSSVQNARGGMEYGVNLSANNMEYMGISDR